MSFSFFISKRLIFPKKVSRFISLISGISIAGIALGVATLIIALSILNGFEWTITNKIVDFDSHIQISSYTGELNNYEKVLPFLKNKLSPYAEDVIPYVSQLAIINSKTIKDGISIKGIRPEDDWKGVREDIIRGKLELNDDPVLPTIIIGKKLADKLMVKIDDKVTIFALNKNRIPCSRAYA
jgi:lipoprotein-releasing system permease protein